MKTKMRRSAMAAALSMIGVGTLLAGASRPADADGSGTVDVNDISYVIFRLGSAGTPGDVDGDADGNGVVDVNDVSFVVFRFGAC